MSVVSVPSHMDSLNLVFAGSGKQGFQQAIPADSFIVDGVGALGNMHSERGLTYYEVALSGHMYVAVHRL